MHPVIKVLTDNTSTLINTALSRTNKQIILQKPDMAEDAVDDIFESIYLPLLCLDDELELGRLTRKYIKKLGKIKSNILSPEETEALKTWVESYNETEEKSSLK